MNSTSDLYDISSFIIDSIPNNSVVCDLGFGNTFLLNKIIEKKLNIKYIGVDKGSTPCNNILNYIKQNNISNVEVYNDDIINFSKNRSDICVLSRVFHHFKQEECKQILTNALNIISFKGRIIIIDSFRDYRNRENRYNYFPLFFVSLLSLLGVKNITCNYNVSSIDVDELWKLVIDIENKNATISFEKYNEEKGV